MTDNLKTLALECKRWNLCDDPSCTCHEALAEFIEAASPDAVLALITQVEVLECALKDADAHIAEQALLHTQVQELRDALTELADCGAEAWGEDRPCVRIAMEVLEKTK